MNFVYEDENNKPKDLSNKIAEINQKYQRIPKMITSILNILHYGNRYVVVFNFDGFSHKNTAIPPNIAKNAKYASLIGKNEILVVHEFMNKYNGSSYLHIFNTDEDSGSYKELKMRPPKTYTVWQENIVYLLSDKNVCKYIKEENKTFIMPHYYIQNGFSVACHIRFGRYLYVIYFKHNAYEVSNIFIKRLDMLDEEAGWSDIGEFEYESTSYILSNNSMNDFAYGFYTFQCLGYSFKIRPPFKYENEQIKGKLKISTKQRCSDMSFLWKGYCFYEYTRPFMPRFKVCDLKTRKNKIMCPTALKKILDKTKKRKPKKIAKERKGRKVKKIDIDNRRIFNFI